MRHLVGVTEGSVFVVEDCSLSCSPDVIELVGAFVDEVLYDAQLYFTYLDNKGEC